MDFQVVTLNNLNSGNSFFLVDKEEFHGLEDVNYLGSFVRTVMFRLWGI